MPGLMDVLSWKVTARVTHPLIHSGHVVILCAFSIKPLLSHLLPPATPSLPFSSCLQTTTLVLHPYSSLLPPPSKTLVLPLMKPKVSFWEVNYLLCIIVRILWAAGWNHLPVFCLFFFLSFQVFYLSWVHVQVKILSCTSHLLFSGILCHHIKSLFTIVLTQ